ncbi:MAG: serpin family protein [Candidatus Entotheonellia bacterium]
MRSKRQRSSDLDLAASSVNQLGFQLLEKLQEDHAIWNLIFSPCSLAFCLAITSNGAAGQTRDKLAKVLGVVGISEEDMNRRIRALRTAIEQAGPQLELVLASAVWGVKPLVFPPDFLQRIQEFYAAEARILDSAGPTAAETINRWVSSKTNEKITTLVNSDDLSSEIRCILTNAIYFKGPWSAPFDPQATRDRPFALPDGRTREVAMMCRSGRYPYLETKAFQAIDLAYTGGSLSMYVFLPREGISLDMSGWREWLPQFRIAHVELALPRLSVSCALDLAGSLGELGLNVLFQPGADFTRMGLAGHFISGIKHKAYIEVGEQGTEASASSAILMGRSLTPVTSMTVDRPFFLAIHDRRSGLLLFLGRIVEPDPAGSGESGR